MKEYIIRTKDIDRNSIQAAACIHRSEIDQGFISSLGYKMIELIFKHAVESKSGILFVAKEKKSGSVCGFLLGTLNTRSFYKEFILKKSIIAIINIIPNIFSLKKIYMILEILLYPSRNEIKDMPDAELLDIAVSREYQGKGLAQILFRKFAEHLKEKNVKEMKITTGESLFRAHRFYEKLGAKRVGEINIHKGGKTIVYKYYI